MNDHLSYLLGKTIRSYFIIKKYIVLKAAVIEIRVWCGFF